MVDGAFDCEIDHEANPNCSEIFLLRREQRTDIIDPAEYTESRFVPRWMIRHDGVLRWWWSRQATGSGLSIPRQTIDGTCTATVYVTNWRGSRSSREVIVVMLALPVESGLAKLYYSTGYLIEPSSSCKWRVATQRSHVLMTGESSSKDAKIWLSSLSTMNNNIRNNES